MRVFLLLNLVFFIPSLYGQGYDNIPPSISSAESDTVIKSYPDSVYLPNPMDSNFQIPQFPGGQEGLVRWLSDMVEYPKLAVESGLEDLVKVEFVVLKNGQVCCVRLPKNGIPVLDAEALRVIRKLPDWRPGLLHGQPVNVKMSIPIRFKLE